MSARHLLPLLLAALAAAPHASAQYQWRDANGRMVYSDLPPPASVPPSAVQRAPARQTPAVAPGGSGVTASEPRPGGTPAAGGAAPSIAEQEMAFRKRRLERAEAERKATQAQAEARRAAAACEFARAQVRTLESGMRVARVNEGGEREVIDEATRASQLDGARRSMREHCPA